MKWSIVSTPILYIFIVCLDDSILYKYSEYYVNYFYEKNRNLRFVYYIR